jgi:hypothetical protein
VDSAISARVNSSKGISVKKMFAMAFGLVTFSLISNSALAWGVMHCDPTKDNKYNVEFNWPDGMLWINGKSFQMVKDPPLGVVSHGIWTMTGHQMTISRNSYSRPDLLAEVKLQIDGQTYYLTCNGH